jgi:hypothetical protein
MPLKTQMNLKLKLKLKRYLHEFCVVQHKIMLYVGTTQNYVEQQKIMLYNRKLCCTTQNYVV